MQPRVRVWERERDRNTNRGRPACKLQQRKKTTTSMDEKKFIIHPSEAIYPLSLRKRFRENADHGWANNEWPFHTSISPSMSNGMRKREDENSGGASCSLQQARMRRRRVWMRIRFLFIHPNLCNPVTVSKTTCWLANANHGWANSDHIFIHPSIHPYPTGCENGWCFESTSAAENVKPGDVVFHPFFSFFSSNFVECELCRVDVGRFCFRCKRKFLSTVLKTR
jgi:hypothetical protein